MTKQLTTTAAFLAAFALPAFAQTMDADGDGAVTLEEAQAAYPDITADSFAAMDSDADGVLSAEEVTAATEAGLLPS